MQSRWWSPCGVLASIFCHRTFCFFIWPGEEQGRGVTCFKLCAVTRVARPGIEFQTKHGGERGGGGSREEEKGGSGAVWDSATDTKSR